VQESLGGRYVHPIKTAASTATAIQIEKRARLGRLKTAYSSNRNVQEVDGYLFIIDRHVPCNRSGSVTRGAPISFFLRRSRHAANKHGPRNPSQRHSLHLLSMAPETSFDQLSKLLIDRDSTSNISSWKIPLARD
jgi:hypothetical protein